MEKFTLTVSYTQSGTPWENTLVQTETFSAEPEDSLKEAAKLIAKIANEQSADYRDGLYFRVVNQYDEVETFLSVNTDDGFFIKGFNNKNGFSSNYMDMSEKKIYMTALDEDTNDYKSYTMYQEQGNSRFGAHYGRIGGADLLNAAEYNFDKEGSRFYSAKMFWIKYQEKIVKGYIDRSETINISYGKETSDEAEKANTQAKTDWSQFGKIEEEDTDRIFSDIFAKQKQYVKDNYCVDKTFSSSFNIKAVEEAENLLNQLNLLTADTANVDMKAFRDTYKELLMIIPRKVSNIKEYIDRVDFKDTNSDTFIYKVLEEEKNLLDAFTTLYGMTTAEEKTAIVKEAKTENPTFLQANHIDANTANFEDEFDILAQMEKYEVANAVSHVLAIRNERQDKAFEDFVRTSGIDKRGLGITKMYHGTRSENVLSIAVKSLVLNPNAVINGKMFGQGLYFAPNPQKSMRYTSLSGSYWAGGRDDKAYMFVADVAMGKPYYPTGSTGCDFKLKDLPAGTDSIFADKNKTGLFNDECIVYREEQHCLRYLLELDNSRVNEKYSIHIDHVKNLCFKDISLEGTVLHATLENPDGLFLKPVKDPIPVSFDLSKDLKEAFSCDESISRIDKELLGKAFMATACDNIYTFKDIQKQILKTEKIPDSMMKAFQTEAKEEISYEGCSFDAEDVKEFKFSNIRLENDCVITDITGVNSLAGYMEDFVAEFVKSSKGYELYICEAGKNVDVPLTETERKVLAQEFIRRAIKDPAKFDNAYDKMMKTRVIPKRMENRFNGSKGKEDFTK